MYITKAITTTDVATDNDATTNLTVREVDRVHVARIATIATHTDTANILVMTTGISTITRDTLTTTVITTTRHAEIVTTADYLRVNSFPN